MQKLSALLKVEIEEAMTQLKKKEQKVVDLIDETRQGITALDGLTRERLQNLQLARNREVQTCLW